MTIAQMQCFYEVSVTVNFSKAAERLYMSQSSISKYIGQLEQELGVALFNRQGKNVELTHEGRKLLPYCSSVLEDMQRLKAEAANLRQNASSADTTIRLCGIPTMSFYGCITLINDFAAEYPNYDVLVDETSESDVHLSLQTGACDIAFCSDIKLNPDRYHTMTVRQEGFRAAMAKKYWSFGNRSEITLADLRGVPLVLNRPESLLFDLCRNSCLANGFEPNVKATSTLPRGIMEYLTGHPYCYIGLSRVVTRYESKQVRSGKIADLPPVNFVFCWDKNSATPAVRKFAAFAQARMPALLSNMMPAE